MKRTIALLAALALLLPLSGCTAEPAEQTFFAMDTVMRVRVWHGSDAQEDVSAVCALIGSLEQTLSVTDPDSELSALNDAGSASVSDDTLYILEQTLALSTRTGGALDPTLCPIVRLWGFTTDSCRVPSQPELAAALETVGTQHVLISADTVTLESGTMLDFGAVAKGYAAQKAAALLTESGVQAALLAFGGNIQTVGTKPDGSAWQIGVQDPFHTDATAAVLSLTGSHAVVTSGGYQRYFEEDGVRYCHIIDPETGAPVQGDLASVTIVADDGLLADGLSTALYVMGLSEACEFWRASDDFEAVLIAADGTVYATEGLAASLSGTEFEVIAR